MASVEAGYALSGLTHSSLENVRLGRDHGELGVRSVKEADQRAEQSPIAVDRRPVGPEPCAASTMSQTHQDLAK